MIALQGHLAASRERLGLEALGLGGPVSIVTVTPRFRASSHVVQLVLPHGSSSPALVAKLPRLRERTRALEREARNLCSLNGRGAGDSVPQLIALEPLAGGSDWPVLLQTAVPGQPLDRATARSEPDRWCEAALEWLEKVTAAPYAGSVELACRVEQELRALAHALALKDHERRAIDATLRVARSAAPVPQVLEHGDLSPPNVLRHPGGGIGVLDWEDADPHGIAACDLFFYLAYVAFARDQVVSLQDHVRAVRGAFVGPGAWGRRYVEAYARRFRVPPRSLGPLLVVCWVRYLARIVERLRAPLGDSEAAGRDALGAETLNWLRKHRYWAIWLDLLAHHEEIGWS